MKKILSVLTLTAAATALCCPSVFAAEIMHSAELGAGISLVFAIPFVGMLLCIAICPLVIPEKWEKWRWLFVLFWSLLFLIPFALTYNVPTMVDQLLESLMGDYLTFIVLLFGLFCVAGNICLEGDLAGTPKTNVLLLLIGTALASWIGTTGASMVMIRPILRANRWRSKCVQTVVFFIFLVSNIGGSLTPIGDPPLLMGFMRGVPFQWTLIHMLPVMALNVVLLLILFAPYLLPAEWGLTTFMSNLGLFGACAVIILALALIKVDGAPLLNIQEAASKNIQWGTVFMVALLMPLGNAISGADSGIMTTLTSVLSPVLQGKSVFIFSLIIIVIGVILTNVSQNLVVIGILMPIVGAMAGEGVNLAAMTVLIALATHYAVLLPSASFVTGIMFSNENVTNGFLYKYGAVICVVCGVFAATVGYLWCNLIF